MGSSTKRTEKQERAGTAVAAPALSRTQPPRKAPEKNGAAARTKTPARALPIRSSPVTTAPSLRAKLSELKTPPKRVTASMRDKPKAKPPFARNPVLQELEPRLLMSADLNPLASDTLLSSPAALSGAEFRSLADHGTPMVVTSAAVAPIQRTNELVFVDTATPDYQALIDGMRESALATGRSLQFVLIDADKDGIRKITDTLAQKSDLDAIHIISHAEDGAVQLGNTQLDFESLLKRAVSVKSWGKALGENGDILIYGCDLAATGEGKSLIEALARLTGADVAASEDLTGAAAKGGDWELEYATGAIEARVAISAAEQAQWAGILAAPVVDLNGPAAFTAADTFATPTYTGGTGSWAGGWVEFDASETRFVGGPGSNSDNSPATGNVVHGTLAGGVGNEMAFVGHNSQYGDWMQRSVDLLSYTSATLSFSYSLENIESPDSVAVQVSKDGGATFTTLGTYATNGSANPSFDISSYISAETVIRFAVTGGFDQGGAAGTDDRFFLDSVQITATGNNYDSSFTEGGLPVAIAGPNTTVVDPDGNPITSAIVTLTNPQAGDVLSWSALPPGIIASLSGNSVTLSGTASAATYATALQQIALSNTSDAPDTTTRTLTVRVTDSTGTQSAVANSFVRIVPVDDPVVAAPDAFATPTNVPVSGNVLADNGSGPDTDVDGTLSVQTTLVAGPANGTVTMNTGGTFTYTPNPAFLGTDTFQYRLLSQAQVPGLYYEYWDGRPAGNNLQSGFPTGAPTTTGYATSFDVDQIALAAGNASLSNFTIRLTTTIEILAGGTYTFWSGSDDGSLVRVTSPAGTTTLVVDNDGPHSWEEQSGTLSLTPGRYTIEVDFYEGNGQEDLNVFYSGADTSNVKTDLGAVAELLAPAYDTATVTITVYANDAPVASGAATLAAVSEDIASPAGGQVSALFAANYSDAADGALATPLSGVAIIANAATAAQGTWQYASVAAGPWSDVPTAGLADTTALVLPASYYLRFLPAANYNGTPGSLTVRLADSSVGATVFSTSANISVAIGGAGKWSAASIALGTSITPVNDAPTVSAPASFAVIEDVAGNLVYTGTPFADVDSASLTVTLSIPDGTVSASSGGGVTVGGTATARTFNGAVAALNTYFTTAGNITYTTALNNNTARTLTTQVSDGSLSASATSTVNITPVNDAPTATNLSAAETYTEDTPLNLVDIVVSDVDSANVTVTLTLSNTTAGNLNTGTSGAVTSTYNPGTGVWTASGATANVNTLLAGLTFTPALNFNSNFTIATSVSDGVAVPITGTKSMTGTPVNDAPLANNDAAAVQEDVTLAASGNVLSNDTDVDAGDTKTVTLVNGAAGNVGVAVAGTYGTVTLNANGSYTYTLNNAAAVVQQLRAGQTVTDTFSYQMSDGAGAPASANLVVTITGSNDAPVAVNDSYSVSEDGSLTVGWWDLNWTQRQQITFSGNTGAGTQTVTNFPVLVTLDSGNIDYTQTQNDGGDLRFFDPDGTPLAYEVEHWDESGTSYVWVKVPQIDTTGTDFIWMYYGNATAPDGQDPSAVWSGNGYSSVYHLDDGGPAIDDATANAFDGTALNGVASATGQIYLAQNFDGANDHIDLGANRAFLNGASAATFSAWINPDTVAAGGQAILTASINNSGTPTDTSRFALERQGDEILVIVRYDDATSTSIQTTATNLLSGQWHYVTGVADLVADTVTIYVNGVAQATTGTINMPGPGTAFPATASASSQIGSNDAGGTSYFDGQIDEARIATAARSAGWVLADYRAMTNAFVTMGGAQSAPATGGVLNNDADADGNSLTATLVSGPVNGALALNADGTFTYTPNADFYGIDTFTYRANDGALDSNLATVTITVTAVVDIAGNSVSTNEDNAVTVNVLANDSFENAGRTVTGVTNGANGTVTIVNGALGTVQYTPNANFNGSDSFTYTVTSGGATETASVTVTVTPVNDAPTLGNGTLASIVEDNFTFAGQTVATIFTGQFADIDAGSSFGGIAVVGNTANAGTQGAWQYSTNGGTDWFAIGTVSDNATALAVSITTLVRFVPVPNYNGIPPALSVRGLDNTYAGGFSTTAGVETRVNVNTTTNGGTTAIAAATATISTSVTPVNDPPVANNDAATVNEDSGANAIAVLANDSILPDAGETLAITTVTQGASGTVAITGGGTGLTYTPNANFFGTDTFTYTISDGNGGTATATVTVTVNNVNDPPVANNDAATVNEDSGANAIAVLANDSILPDAGETLAITTVTQGASGTVAITGGGTGLTYTPNANFFGTDTFTYTISDGNGGTATATVTVTVNNVNDDPILVNNTFAITDGGTFLLIVANLSATDIDDAAGALVFTVAGVTHGRFEVAGAAGTPIAAFTQQQILDGEVRFVHDGSGITPTFTVVVSDGTANDGPYLGNISFTGRGGGSGGAGGGTTDAGPVSAVTPPAPPASSQPPAIGLTSAAAQNFLRAPTSPPLAGGDAASADTPAAPPRQAAGGPSEKTAIATELPTIRTEAGMVPLQPSSQELKIDPPAAEMRVLPIGRGEDDVNERVRAEVVLNSIRMTGLALSVGAVWWAARAAGLMASLLASSPAWRHVDPLPVLGRDEEDEEEHDFAEEDKERNDEEHRAAWVLEGREPR